MKRFIHLKSTLLLPFQMYIFNYLHTFFITLYCKILVLLLCKSNLFIYFQDLKRRLQSARIGHEQLEDVQDFEYGINVGTLQEWKKYWLEEYDWRKSEAILNSFQHYRTEIEGLNVGHKCLNYLSNEISISKVTGSLYSLETREKLFKDNSIATGSWMYVLINKQIKRWNNYRARKCI